MSIFKRHPPALLWKDVSGPELVCVCVRCELVCVCVKCERVCVCVRCELVDE